jgi:rare lipoprotein A
VLESDTLGVANKTLPCGTWVRVCAERCRNVRVIDRGPYVEGRDFDLTEATAYAVGFPIEAGVATIRYAAYP